jgi:hypothetical protein
MPVNESLRNILDKAWEEKPLAEIIQQSPEVLQGLSAEKAAQLKAALGVTTIEQFANNKYVRWAQALTSLAPHEPK